MSKFIAPFMGWALVDDFKISLDVVAALLTIIGFSINDTIVIFDRLRELRGKSRFVTADMVDRAVNQTLSRTILTSGTALLATLILYLFGGQGIHAFAFTMLVGIITGSYSTIYIAAPIVLWLQHRFGGAAERTGGPVGAPQPA
jgi:SecD/SecF fusion protein